MPTEISDWNDLDNVRNDLNGDYVLVNDLDSDTNGYDGIGDDFEPIGFTENEDFTSEFGGSFDGDGFSISDLVIEIDDEGDEGDIGLFASTGGGAVIENVSVGGSVTVTNGGRYLGGLVGHHDGSTIQNCVSHVDVTAVDGEIVGGVAGLIQGTVTESYVTGSVVGDEQVGGLVGQNFDTITDSYVIGSVEGDERVGGLVGRNRDTIQTSYAVGLVTGNTDVGGLCSDPHDDGSVTDSYWDTEATGQDTSDGGTGLTTAEMQGSEAETNMDGLDFANVWETVE